MKSLKNSPNDFWGNVDMTKGPDACWPWKLYRHKNGYGQASMGGKKHRAHRLAFSLSGGTLPEVVMHTCDNPPCCNPKHLAAGTQDINNKDRARKGRSVIRFGELSNNAKLTKEQVLKIRRDYGEGRITQAKLAKNYGVQACTIHLIIRGKSWANS